MSESANLLALNQRLLDSIAEADWKTYSSLCDAGLTAFEPEAAGQLVEGLAFHKYYFDLGAPKSPRQTTMIAPHVRIMGEAAVVSCTRLLQKLGDDGRPVTAAFNESRIWHNQNGEWKHVHFHRS